MNMNSCHLGMPYPWKIHDSYPISFTSYSHILTEHIEINCLINSYRINKSGKNTENYCRFADNDGFHKSKNNFTFVMLKSPNLEDASLRQHCFIVEARLMPHLSKLTNFLKKQKSNYIYDLSDQNEVYIHCKELFIWETFYNIFNFFLGQLYKSFIVGEFFCLIKSWQLLKNETKFTRVLKKYFFRINKRKIEQILSRRKKFASNLAQSSKSKILKYKDLEHNHCVRNEFNSSGVILNDSKKDFRERSALVTKHSQFYSEDDKIASYGKQGISNYCDKNENSCVKIGSSSGSFTEHEFSVFELQNTRKSTVHKCKDAKWTVHFYEKFMNSKIPSYTEIFLKDEICLDELLRDSKHSISPVPLLADKSVLNISLLSEAEAVSVDFNPKKRMKVDNCDHSLTSHEEIPFNRNDSASSSSCGHGKMNLFMSENQTRSQKILAEKYRKFKGSEFFKSKEGTESIEDTNRSNKSNETVEVQNKHTSGICDLSSISGNNIPTKKSSECTATGDRFTKTKVLNKSYLKKCEEKIQFVGETATNNASNWGSIGFQTASGKNIKISNRAIESANKLLSADLNFEPEETKNTVTISGASENPSRHCFGDFQTAAGKEVNISADALKAANKMFSDDALVKRDSKNEHLSSESMEAAHKMFKYNCFNNEF